MAKQVVIRLSPEQAHKLWGIIDGAADAGACSEGLDPVEKEACDNACSQLMRQLVALGLMGKRKP